VRVDVREREQIKNFQELIDMADISVEKISRKNRPTFLLLCDDRVSKMKPSYFNSKFDNKFSEKIENETR